ncbi:phBC6A51 family helix-turn-helix protein [Clostridium estertheticum]|uniref:Homeodomain phBC6A51-type domain-containing protein n=1 Tax=Clostridium estertheticum subsp. estertheticum TaxID=1552 RepID=A0A1J0GI95_9CLOT|nr:phBC6A51 family helix-turn-helix protein [Clostridium estertheticum]APC41073.1 hypothetical protein A7L45_13810 [Clostridium estertheticum subsp. estertheticum]
MRAQGIDVVKIASTIGINRATFYNWEKSEEFAAEVDRCKQEFLTQSKNRISYLSIKAVRVLDEQMDSGDEKRSFDAASKILDKSHSNATKIELSDGRDTKDNVPVDVLDEEIKEFDKEPNI